MVDAHGRSTGRDFPDLRVERGDIGPVRWCLTTRYGGNSTGAFAESNVADHVGDDPKAVHSNRSLLARALGADDGVVFIRAEHQGAVARIGQVGEPPVADGLMTDVAGVGIAALGADCAIVGLAGRKTTGESVVATVHCGWKGLIADIVGAGVLAMRDEGVREISAVVGPAICGRCYVVDGTRITQVRENCTAHVVREAIVEGASENFADGHAPEGDRVTGGAGLDIGAGVRARLHELEVELIADFGCTYEHDRWFSLRRATHRHGPGATTGRQALGMVIVR